jgi:hypothetical protein
MIQDLKTEQVKLSCSLMMYAVVLTLTQSTAHRVSIPYGTTSKLICLGFFQILEYLHIHSDIPWRWDPSLSKKFILISYTPHTHSLKVILHSIFSTSRF